MPRLTSLSFTTSPRLPGMHGAPLSFDLPIKSGPMTGWKVALVGDKVLLRSPPGWQPGQSTFGRPAERGQEITVYSVPRSWVAEQWEFAPGETITDRGHWMPGDWDEGVDFSAPAVEVTSKDRPMNEAEIARVARDRALAATTPEQRAQALAFPPRRPGPAPMDPEVAERLAQLDGELGLKAPKAAPVATTDEVTADEKPARKKPGPKPKAVKAKPEDLTKP